MFIKVNLLDKRYCTGCPYSRGICGCSKYLNDFGENTNCGCTKQGEPIRLPQCLVDDTNLQLKCPSTP